MERLGERRGERRGGGERPDSPEMQKEGLEWKYRPCACVGIAYILYSKVYDFPHTHRHFVGRRIAEMYMWTPGWLPISNADSWIV